MRIGAPAVVEGTIGKQEYVLMQTAPLLRHISRYENLRLCPITGFGTKQYKYEDEDATALPQLLLAPNIHVDLLVFLSF